MRLNRALWVPLVTFRPDVFASGSVNCTTTVCDDVATVYDQHQKPHLARVQFSPTREADADEEDLLAKYAGFDGSLSVPIDGGSIEIGSVSYCYVGGLHGGLNNAAFAATIDDRTGKLTVSGGLNGVSTSSTGGSTGIPALNCNASSPRLFPWLLRSPGQGTENSRASLRKVWELLQVPLACRDESDRNVADLMQASCEPDTPGCDGLGFVDFRSVAKQEISVWTHNSSATFWFKNLASLNQLQEKNSFESILVLLVVLLVSASAWSNAESHQAGDLLYTECSRVETVETSETSGFNIVQPGSTRFNERFTRTRKLVALIDVLCVVARLCIVGALRRNAMMAASESTYLTELISAILSLVAQLSFTEASLKEPDNSSSCIYGGSLASASGSIAILTLFSSAPLRSQDFNGLVRLISASLAILLTFPRSIWAICIISLEFSRSRQLQPSWVRQLRTALATAAWTLQSYSLFQLCGILVAYPSGRAWSGASTISGVKMRIVVLLAMTVLGSGRLLSQAKHIAGIG